MSLSDDPYIRRLQQDGATTWAGSLCMLATILPTVGIVTLLVPGSHLEARANPLYWLIMLVPANWAWQVIDYKPWALRMVRPVLLLLPAAAGAVAVCARAWSSDMTPYRVMLGLVCLLVIAGGLAYRRSLLAREGAGDA